MLSFAHPYYLLLLALLPLIYLWYLKKGRLQEATVRYSAIHLIPQKALKAGRIKNITLHILRAAVLALSIIALARPIVTNIVRETNTDVIDIMLVIDQSSSMLAQDFDPDRLGAAKEVAKTFIRDRAGDRLGLIVFAGKSFIQCPLTTDMDVLVQFTEQIEITSPENDGTAIGMAIANALNRLRSSDAKSRIMILLSDGSNNKGEIDPLTAADLAAKFGIKIYTIGAGTRGIAPVPVFDAAGNVFIQRQQVVVDEETLKEIAQITDGKFFRATDNESLQSIYSEINELERTEIQVTEYKNTREMYAWLTIPAALLAILLMILSKGVFRKLI